MNVFKQFFYAELITSSQTWYRPTRFSSTLAYILASAGGKAGNSGSGSSGGAGGLSSCAIGSFYLLTEDSYSITIGQGGQTSGATGGNTSFGSLITVGYNTGSFVSNLFSQYIPSKGGGNINASGTNCNMEYCLYLGSTGSLGGSPGAGGTNYCGGGGGASFLANGGNGGADGQPGTDGSLGSGGGGGGRNGSCGKGGDGYILILYSK